MRKLNKREMLLLKILIGFAMACGVIVLLAVKLPEMGSIQSNISLLEENIKNVNSLQVNEKDLGSYFDTLKSGIEKEKAGYYGAGERDLNRLGIQLLDLLKRYRMSYKKLNKVTSREGSYVEIACTGSIVNVLSFLKDIYSGTKYLNISFLSLKNTGGRMNVTLRMNYGEI